MKGDILAPLISWRNVMCRPYGASRMFDCRDCKTPGWTMPRYLVRQRLSASRDHIPPSWVIALATAFIIAACNPGGERATTTTSRADGRAEITIEGAITLRVVSGRDGSAWAAWTDHTGFWAAPIALGAFSLEAPILIGEGLIHHPLERPALAITDDGGVLAAWITTEGEVRFRILGANPVTISGPVRPETALVQMIALESGEPVVSWLEDSTLSVATGSAAALVEHEGVDGRTCDCCHPVPIELSDDSPNEGVGSFGIGYRDLEDDGRGVVRDIKFLRGSGDDVFSSPVPVADEHWYLDACPLSGPTLAVFEGEVLVAWMDARQSLHPEQNSSSVWFDRSVDGGLSFGNDIRLTGDEATYRTPAMAIDSAGRLHLVWERRTPEEASIEYMSSGDGGLTFAQPVALVEGTDRVPSEPALATVGQEVLVSWIDSAGGYVRRVDAG